MPWATSLPWEADHSVTTCPPGLRGRTQSTHPLPGGREMDLQSEQEELLGRDECPAPRAQEVHQVAL